MYVKHGLSPVIAGVDHDPITLFLKPFLPGNFRSLEHELAEKFGIFYGCVLYGSYVLFRDHQYMGWRCRADIMKRKHVFVVIHLVRGYVPCDNFAEQAII